MKKTVLFKLALCFILLSVSLNAQMTKFVQPNMKPERDIYFDGKGVRYSDVVKVKFNGNFIKTASGKKEVQDNEVDNLTLKEVLLSISKKYGKVSIEKVFPAAFWGDTLKVNKRTHKKVITLDMSQIVALNFSKLVPIDSIISSLKNEAFVEWAEGPIIRGFTAAPNDPRYVTGEQWGLANIEAPKAWDITQGNKVISINDYFDGTASRTHDDIIGNVIYTSMAMGPGGHGISIAGIASAVTNNNLGIASLGWNTKLRLEDWNEGNIDAAVRDGADVINFSWYSVYGDYYTLRTAVYNALVQGVVCVAAATNAEPVIPFVPYPAGYNFGSVGQVIAVSGTWMDGTTEKFVDGWNYSPGTDPVSDPINSFIDVSAPGDHILIATQDADYGWGRGTSDASPLVSALCAQILSINESLTPNQVYDILKNSSDKIGQYSYTNGWNRYMGYGRVNAYKALKYTLENYGGKLVQSLTIPSGETWNIKPGVTISLANNASIIVNGTFVADAGTGSPITFQRSDASGRWGNLVFDGAGVSGSKLINVTLNDGNEVRCLNGANVKILNSRLNNFYHGVYIYNAAPEIRDNNIDNPYQNGVHGEASGLSPVIVHNTISKTNYSGEGVFLLNGTVPYVAYNDISGCDYGVYFGGGAHAYFTEHVYLPYEEYKIFWPNNRFTDNNTALCAAWGGFISGGSSGYNSWYNTIKPSRSYDAYSYQKGTLIAQYNYWGGVTPRTYNDGTSTLDVSNVLGIDPWENPDVMSVTTKDNSATSKPTLSKTSVNGSETDPVDLLEGVKLENEGKLNDAISWYKSLVNSDKYQSFAFTELMRIKNKYSKGDILSYLEGLTKVKKNSYLLKMLGDNYLQNGQFDKAMAWFDNAVSSSASEQETLDAKFSKLFAFINIKKDLGKAQEILSEIKKGNTSEFYFSSRIETAENLMGDPSAYYANKGEKQENSGESLENSGIVKDYALSQNYPNPFNPSTVINYELPRTSKVSLKVYNILGKEVATLVDGYKEMGRYSVQFNAKDIPSGMYIYEIRANNFIRSGKMLLLK